MKTNNLLISLAVTLLLAIGAGLWFTRRKDEPVTTRVGIRNIAPEATLVTSSTGEGFKNERSILSTAGLNGFVWGATGWNDATTGVFPDWVELAWPVNMSITEVVITGLGGKPGVEPYPVGTGIEGGTWGLRDFTVQAWINGAWSTVVNVTGNTKDKTTHTLASAVVTQKLRINVTDSQDHVWSRIVNLQVTGQEA